MINWNNNDTKYIIKRLIIGFGMLILFSILTSTRAKADSLAPSTLQYYKPNRTNTWTRSPSTMTNQGQTFYHTSTTSINDIAGIYGVVNNQVSGSYFTFNAIIPPYDYYLVGEIQLLDGSFVSCNTNALATSGSDSYFYTFTCETVEAVQVYKYGVYVTSATGYGVTENSFALSKLAGFENKGEYNQYLIDLQQSITGTGAQAHQDAQQIYNTITSDNVDGANGDLDNFKNNSTFSDNTGLQAVIQLPLNLVNSFTTSCQPISITIPWLDYTGSIPCMSNIYRQHFNNLYSVVSLIVNAFFIYRILLKIYELVHEAKQPDEDKLEVIDL